MVRFSRDPALYLTLVATAIRLSSIWLHLSIDQQALLNAAVTAAAGLLVAAIVRHEGQMAALVGVVQALLAVAIGFGLHVSPENQAVFMSFVGAVAAAFVRTQVTAPVDAQGVARP